MTQAQDDYHGGVPAGSVAVALAPAAEDGASTAPAWVPVVLSGGLDDPAVRANRPALDHRRLRGLDGLRAIAVLSVVAFHLDFSLAPGGFLGVDVFFVISGFLITNLLANEILTRGSVHLGRFYWRRARRLLPTVFALLIVVIVAGTTLWRDQLNTLQGGVLSSLTYVTNWWLIAAHQPYFVSTGRPSMLAHLWSLAIEEQYYLLWSVVVLALAGVLMRSRHAAAPEQRLRLVVLVAAGLAVASAAVMASYAEHADLPYSGSTSRVYFGSDTHTMGLFLGSAAGAWLALRTSAAARSVRPARPRRPGLTDGLGIIAVGVVVYEFDGLNEFSPGLYRGGFLLFDVVVLLAILCAVRPRSLFGLVLDMRPVRWIGRRSYSIYVWHWPVVVVTRPGLDVGGPVWLVNLARVALILALASLSYHFVEVPLRSNTLRAWRRERGTRSARRGTSLAVLTLLVTTIGLAISAGPVDATGTPTPKQVAGYVAPPPPVTSTNPASDPASGTAPGPSASSRPVGTFASGPAAAPSISAFGDSVLLGARSALHAATRSLYLDAVEGRQAYAVLADVVRFERQHRLQPDVVVHVGNNGIVSPMQLDATIEALHDRTRVVLLTDRVSRDWQDPNNRTIRAAGRRHANVRIVDWYALSASHASWLYADGLHLTPTGAAAYTRVVMQALQAK